MKRQPSLRLLVRLFEGRFFEDDTAAPGSGFAANIHQMLGILAALGFFAAYLTMPVLFSLSVQGRHTPAADWALRNFRLFLPALSFAAVGFTTVFYWDVLFPDRRDFLILSQFPIPLGRIFVAKFVALGLFIGMLYSALNLCPMAGAVLFCIFNTNTWNLGFRLLMAQLAATAGASVFALLLAGSFQGILVNISSPRTFRRFSPWLQTIGMSLMVLSVSTYPVYIQVLRPAAEGRALWLWFFPPVWFTGFYDLLLPEGDPFFASLGRYAIAASALALVIFCITWSLGFQRHVRRTLESEDTLKRRPPRGWLQGLAASPQEAAIFLFCRKTLARNMRPRLFLATWVSIGIATGLFIALAVTNGKPKWSPDGVRTFPFLIAFFVISGFRAVFQFPADLACNWLFQIAESRWAEAARRAARTTAVLFGLFPVLLAIVPFEFVQEGWRRGLLHVLFQVTAGALLIELMFWKFDKMPFGCSYFAGKKSLSILAVIYLYGLTTYSFNMADLEKAAEGQPMWAVVFVMAGAALLAASWRRNPAASEVTFEGGEPLIQTLDLN